MSFMAAIVDGQRRRPRMHANGVLTICPRGVGGPMGGAGRAKNGRKPVILVVHADDQTGRTASRDGWSRGTARRKDRRERWARGRRAMAESAGRRGMAESGERWKK